MAIFGAKKNKVEKKAEKKVVVPAVKVVPVSNFSEASNASHNVLKQPRITEKAGVQAEAQGIYTFETFRAANKKQVAKAIEERYKVKPIKVNITNLPIKKVFSRGKSGQAPGVKKAVVYLKKGDKIEFI